MSEGDNVAGGSRSLRVKDVAYLYYCQLHPSYEGNQVAWMNATHAERDAKIAGALSEIQRAP